MDSDSIDSGLHLGRQDESSRSCHSDNALDKQAFDTMAPPENRHLNFNIGGDGYESKSTQRNKTPRDPLSHRIIEKRRRDRMNNCLADLSRLIPASYMKQGQGRIEKTEIIEMAITLINTLTDKVEAQEKERSPRSAKGPNICCMDQLSQGFHECKDTVMRFLVEDEGMCSTDDFCERIMSHLGQAGSKLVSSVSGLMKDEKQHNMSDEVQNLVYAQQVSPSRMAESDKQLRCLLTNFEEEKLRIGDSNSESNMTNASMLSPYTRAEASYFTRSSEEIFTDFVRPDSDIGSVNSGGQGNVYKFKHNITQRFSKEKNGSNPSDTSSSSSGSLEDSGKLRRKWNKGKLRNLSRLAPYPSYSDSSSGNNSNGTSSYNGDVSGQRSDTSSLSESVNNMQSSNIPLPGFVLHPMGTHYFPISIHPSIIPESFHQIKFSNMALFHPISIPVQFCGPFISMGGEQSSEAISAATVQSSPLTYTNQPGTKVKPSIL